MIETLNIKNTRVVKPLESSNGVACYSKPSKTPFLIILHSLGKNEEQAIKLAELLPKYAFILSVRAPIEWRVDGDESFAWFDVKGPYYEVFTKESDVIDSVEYLKKIIEETKTKFEHMNLDEPIILGFSQGGIVALTAAVEEMIPLKGVYCHCGFYEKKLDTGKTNIKTNIMMTNGTNDPIIPMGWAYISIESLRTKCKTFEHNFIHCGHEIEAKVIETFTQWLKKII
jgi:phospholipase/carboxylesterase